MNRSRSWLLPSPADISFMLVAFSAAVLRGWQAINTDGDLGRHLRVGREILAHGLFYTDRFSWTMQGQPFVPYEWGSEVLFALAHRAAGLPGVVALTAIVIALAYFSLNLLLARLGVDPLLAFLTTLAAAMLGAVHWLARPHVFSLGAVVGVVAILETAGRQDGKTAGWSLANSPTRRLALCTFLLFALWSNLHGGFLYGLVLIGFYLAGDVAGILFDRPRREHVTAARRHGVLLGAALVGSCINPSGPAILPHVMGYLGKTWLVDMTVEYRSPDFHGAFGREFLLVLLVVITALALVRRRLSWPHLAAFLGTTAFALHSTRNVPLWALTALPVVVLHADASWRRFNWRPAIRVRGAFANGATLARAGLWTALPAFALVLLAVHSGQAGGVQLLPTAFDPRVFPVRIVERARAEHVSGRIFNELAWGGYILDAWPEQKVFIDGQTDFYGEPLSQLYELLRSARGDAPSRLDSLGVSMVLLPDDTPLTRSLTSSQGWFVADSADGALRIARHSGP